MFSTLPQRKGKHHMLRKLGATLLLASGLAIVAVPALAIQVSDVVTKNSDGTLTYHFSVKTDPGETLTPGSDFVTIYNFGGVVEGSAKTPAGWEFSTPEFGKTPTWNGYPAVMPVDIPVLNNLCWTPTKAIGGGMKVEGFSVTVRAGGTTEGEYSGQVTRSEDGKPSLQAVIGHIATP